jgi:hypothetical protein
MIGPLRTKKFYVLGVVETIENHSFNITVNLNCSYSSKLLRNVISKKKNCKITNNFSKNIKSIQISDFESIDWDLVLKSKSGASSYLVRKGLSRKAQLSLQLRRYISKHALSELTKAIPYTIVLETWNAFDSMKIDFCYGTSSVVFEENEISLIPFRQRLDWCLEDAKNIVDDPINLNLYWILKPSVTNKGLDISICKVWEDVLDIIEKKQDIREWVLQKYIDNPLLVFGHKFHLRVYVLCIGALRVFVYDNILMLIAAQRFLLAMKLCMHYNNNNYY